MNQKWYVRLWWWLCEKTGHLWVRKGWIYDGHYHRDCRLCGRIVSEPIARSKYEINHRTGA